MPPGPRGGVAWGPRRDHPYQVMTPGEPKHYYLRVSLTEACAFRCPYCLPEGPKALTPRRDLLSPAEIGRAVRVLSELGVTKVRLTGGEPLQRQGCVEIAGEIARIAAIRDLSLTTNGEYLAALAGPLKAAGVRRLNVHLDSLDPARFRAIARRSDLAQVLRGIDAAVEAGFSPVKINTVVMAGINDGEIFDLCRFALERRLTVRFIELMNTGSAPDFFRRHFVSAAEIRRRIAERYRLAPRFQERGSSPAREWLLEGGEAVVGFIASESEPFCDRCNRLRLTADGRFARCLYEAGGIGVRDLLRDPSVSDEELKAVLAAAIGEKRSHHPEFGKTGEQPFSMSQVGG